MTTSSHVAVMVNEAMDALDVHPGGVYVDATLGGGTHSEELLKRSSPNGKVLSLDVDPAALERGRQRFEKYGSRWQGAEGNFRHLADMARRNGFAPADGVLLDLGLSTDLLLDPKKGLSFKIDGPLDMRFGPESNPDGLTAAAMVNSWREDELTELIRAYGEERFARRISAAMVKARKHHQILRTLELVSIIADAVPKNYERGRLHPATRTFQALRLAVNDELPALKDAIRGGTEILGKGGRIAIISFHSLEDRIVKNEFKNNQELAPLFKKPLIPSPNEIQNNPSARSAKLRAAAKDRKNAKIKYVAPLRHVTDQAP